MRLWTFNAPSSTTNKGNGLKRGRPPGAMDEVVASAPGKVVLFGEHAVVYGHPAIAASIAQRTTVTLRTTEEPGVHIGRARVDFERHPHLATMIAHLWDETASPGLDLSVTSDVPRGAGLGSSAAFAVASAVALRAAGGRAVDAGTGAWLEGYASDGSEVALFHGGHDVRRNAEVGERRFGQDALSLEEASLLGHVAEAMSQDGRASPMDTLTSAYGGLVLLSNRLEREDAWIMRRTMPMGDAVRSWELHRLEGLHFEEGLSLVVGHTGINAPTTNMVAGVAARRTEEAGIDETMDAIGALVHRGMEALLAGDAEGVGRAMTENHLLLRRLGVSHPALETLVSAALPTSLGAKLTGAGGGGCMIALTQDPKATSEAIELAGGRTWITSFGTPGARLEACPKGGLINPK
ncbi:MAG TPA: mevalonate kinase [Candidatus Poseidoniales archaeon]|nr:MAG TPA: mevalonate kinase [Candidatus Poseidoniales archaeon]